MSFLVNGTLLPQHSPAERGIIKSVIDGFDIFNIMNTFSYKYNFCTFA